LSWFLLTLLANYWRSIHLSLILLAYLLGLFVNLEATLVRQILRKIRKKTIDSTDFDKNSLANDGITKYRKHSGLNSNVAAIERQLAA